MPFPFFYTSEGRICFAALVVFVIVGVAVIIRYAIRQVRPARLPYVLEETLFTPAERQFLGVLKEILPHGVDYYGKIRLIDIFRPERHLAGPDRLTAVNKVASKHIDFLLVRNSDTKPLLAIELDDKSHQAPDRIQRDAFVNRLFADAGLPLLRFPVQRSYPVLAIQEKIAAALPKIPVGKETW
jgi:hypothetical protein